MLENIANVAEIIGVTLVLATLIFLTLQIRQNTRAIRSTTIQAIMQSEFAFGQILTTHAGLRDKILAGEMPGEGEQMRRAIILFNLFMIDTETRFHQFISGYLDENAWEGRFRTLPTMIVLPIYPHWRQSIGGRTRSIDFLELVDGIYAEAN